MNVEKSIERHKFIFSLITWFMGVVIPIVGAALFINTNLVEISTDIKHLHKGQSELKSRLSAQREYINAIRSQVDQKKETIERNSSDIALLESRVRQIERN